MVYAATRGDVPVRLGPGVRHVPDYGPSVMSRDAYTDPMRFELERERVLNRSLAASPARSTDVPAAGDWTSFESHGETVVDHPPARRLARRVPQRLPAPRHCAGRRVEGLRRPPLHLPVPRLGVRHHGQAGRRARARRLLRGAPARRARARPSPSTSGAAASGSTSPGPTQAPPLAEWIGPEIMADLGNFRMEDMVVLEVLEWDVPVSYKAIVDGFNEIYHVTALHHVDARVHQVGARLVVPHPRQELHVLRPPRRAPR